MKTLGIIPARGGSKRLPGKNLLRLGGKPLVAWVLEAALGAVTLDRLVVSSDDPAVLALARTYGPALALRRPAALATDTAPALGYVRHALGAVGEGIEAVVILQPSSPLTLPEDIDATVRLLETTGAESAVSVVRLDHAVHPLKLKTLDGDRLRPYWAEEDGRMAAHELPPLYVRNGAVYASRRAVHEAGRILGDDCRAHVMPRARSVDINTGFDLRFAQFLLDAPPRQG